MDKINLDELFREKFKAFRKIPDEKVWTAIENSLERKRKKRVVPLWWKLSGVAAVLAIALIALYPFGDTVDENMKVTDTERTERNATNPNNAGPDKEDVQEEIISVPETTHDEVVDGSEDENKIQLTATERTHTNEDAEKSDTTQEHVYSQKKSNSHLLGNKDAGALAATKADTSKKREVAETDTAKMEGQAKKQDEIVPHREAQALLLGESDKNAIATDEDSSDKMEEKTGGNQRSIFEALEDQPDDKKLTRESGSRWSAGPSVAPVYFNAMGEGSPIDPGFSSNSKSGSTNLSFGLSIAYAVNNKLRVRSGIYKAEYGYDTKDVGFSPTLAASLSGRLQNIDYAGDSENLAVNDAISNPELPNAMASEFSALNSARGGTVAQNFGYLEVPLELDYALLDRRFGVNLVGGISSLFLIDNSVTLSSGELTAEIGEARNLNDLNFSTNIGFGINYKFTPKIQLNIEPVFKYQLNTFSNTSGDFRPYSIGVYSGMNFKF